MSNYIQSRETTIATRLSNALFADAWISNEALSALGSVAQITDVKFNGASTSNKILGFFHKKYGGLWVGGKTTLTNRKLYFHANSLNRSVHDAPKNLEFALPLVDITSTEVRFGILTKIIDIQVADRKFSIRCFQAEKFASQINQARHSCEQENK